MDRKQKPSLRIALMIYGDIAQKSGGFLYDRELVRGLQKLGCAIDILSMPWPSNLAAKTITCSAVSLSKRESQLQSEVYDRRTQERVWERVWTTPYDILLQDELCHQVLADFNQKARRYQRKIVSIVHNLAHRSCKREDKSEYHRREKEYLEGVDGVIANSLFTFRTVAEMVQSDIPMIVAYPSLGINPKSWPSLLNSKTTKFESGQTRTIETIKFISVGNVTRIKRFHWLLESLAALSTDSRSDGGKVRGSSLRSMPWNLRIVGDVTRDPSYVKQLEQVIDRYQLHHQIEFTGHLEGRALANAYREADIMVLATHEEGFGIACLEALAFGLPTIASREGAAGEIISDGVDGILFDPNLRIGPGSLLEALRIWIPSSVLAFDRVTKRIQEFGRNAERNAQRFSNWSCTASDVFDFLLRVLDGERPHSN